MAPFTLQCISTYSTPWPPIHQMQPTHVKQIRWGRRERGGKWAYHNQPGVGMKTGGAITILVQYRGTVECYTTINSKSSF